MKKTSLLSLCLTICVITFTNPALAQSSSNNWWESLWGNLWGNNNNPHIHDSRCGHNSTPPRAVPEIDAASAGLALALTGSLLAVYRERRKSK